MNPLIAAAAALLVSTTALAAQPQGAAQGGPGGDPIKQMDANGDGRVTLAEAEAQSARMFARLDANRDGRLSQDEARPRGPRQGSANRPAPRDGAPAGRPGGPRMDSNGDGVITQAEFTGGARQMFKRMDRNGDGVLSGAEMTPPKRPGN